MSSEFVAQADLQIVRYAQVWEDHAVLEAALRITPDDDVLSIASAGENALALLARAPRSVTALDISPAQVALLELKLAALRALPHGDFLTLLGVDADGGEAAARGVLYDRIRAGLSPAARAFWDAHPGELREGLLHCGRLERYLAGFHEALRRLHPKQVLDTLFGFSDPREQGEYFARHVATPAFCAIYCEWFGRDRVQAGGRHPSQYRYVTVADPGAWGLARLRDHCGRVLLRDNPYLIYWLRGRAAIAEAIAASRLPHLRPDGYEALRGLLPRLRVAVGDVARFVTEEPAGTFSKVNLSNVYEYMSESDTASLCRALGTRLRPGGRLAYWNMLVARDAAVACSALQPCREAAEQLHRLDRLYFYSAFRIEETDSP